MAYFSRLLADIPGIRHAFLDVHESSAFDHSRIVDIKQVHGADILFFVDAPTDRPHVDGVFTAHSGKPVGVFTADCLPLLMASRDGRFIASVHAGWRGMAQGIVQESVNQFSAAGVEVGDIVVAIGPHIRPCCYEVSASFYDALLETPAAERVHQYGSDFFLTAPRAPNANSATAREENSLWFDLQAFCHQHLLDAGVSVENIDSFEACTYCMPQAFGSYRRRTHYPATKTQQISWVERRI